MTQAEIAAFCRNSDAFASWTQDDCVHLVQELQTMQEQADIGPVQYKVRPTTVWSIDLWIFILLISIVVIFDLHRGRKYAAKKN